MKRPQIIGVTLSETKAEAKIAKLNVSENSRNMRPIMPGMNRSGMKAAINDRLIEITVKPICRAPNKAARNGFMPDSILRLIFSTMTIASSTTKPTEMTIAMRERLSSVKPAAHMPAKATPSDSGTVTPAAMTGAARRRKTSTTIITRAMEITSEVCKSATEARIITVRSDIVLKLTPGGIQRCKSGKMRRTPSTVLMTLASGSLVICSRTAGLPLYQPAARVLRTPRVTVATSPKRTTAPPLVRTIILA